MRDSELVRVQDRIGSLAAGVRIRHIATRREDWVILCLTHMARVIGNPEYVGHRPGTDSRRVEFVREVGVNRRLLLVAVKFMDDANEAWVSTAHPLEYRRLTKRLRLGTMREVLREP